MAEEQDDSQKTEEPSQKRLDEARQKGQIAVSREVNHWFMILAATMFVAMLMPEMLKSMSDAILPFLEKPEAIATDPATLQTVAFTVFARLLKAGMLPLVLVVAAALG